MEDGIEIIAIEDDQDILNLLEYHLQKEGYAFTGFLSTKNVEQFLEEESPALMIVDRNLPGLEGSEFVSQMRQKGHTIPVIFLTARDKEKDLVEGFECGGDDYVTKPFSNKELMVRVKALLARSGVGMVQKIRFRDIKLDLAKREAWVDKEPIDLTNLEFKLLQTFVSKPNVALERDFLRDEVWKDESIDFHDKTINVAISRLKKKIDPDGTKNYFLPVWGVGYKMI